MSSDVAFAAGPVRDGEPRARLAGSSIVVPLGPATIALTQGYAPWSGSSVAGLGPATTALAAYAGTATTGARTTVPLGRGALTFDAGTGGAGATRTLGATRIDAAGVGWSDGRWSVGGGIVSEAGAVFGSRSAGTLRLGAGANTGFVEARYARAVGRWQLSGYGSVGVTDLRAFDASLLTPASTIVTSRFGIEAARIVGPARVVVGVAQPLNVERGSATLTWADGYRLADRALTFRTAAVDLAGERQLLAQASIDLGGLRFGIVQGMLRAETGVVTSLDWRF